MGNCLCKSAIIETCPICLEEIKKNSYKTQCGHIFHSKCIVTYKIITRINGNIPSCPMCRQNLKK